VSAVRNYIFCKNKSNIAGIFLFNYDFFSFSREVLKEKSHIDDGIGLPDWRLTLYLLLGWVVIFLTIVKGVKSSGKVAYFLAIFPYIVMITILVRGATLDGAINGIWFFLKPQWKELLNPKVSFQ
jgi:solute carrier family 6 (neurotransmitter transporter, glycine) member 5/9